MFTVYLHSLLLLPFANIDSGDYRLKEREQGQVTFDSKVHAIEI